MKCGLPHLGFGRFNDKPPIVGLLPPSHSEQMPRPWLSPAHGAPQNGLAAMLQEVCGAHFQRLRQSRHDLDRWVAYPALDLGNISPVHPGQLAKLSLRPSALLADLANVSRQHILDVHRQDGA